jgi:hypothetical protein
MGAGVAGAVAAVRAVGLTCNSRSMKSVSSNGELMGRL